MANKKQLDILKHGVQAWYQWREKHQAIRPDLSHADLSHAHLDYANLKGANLRSASLSDASLSDANLFFADLRNADLSGAFVGWTSFGDIDLSVVKNLEAAKHIGPSTIGIDTIIRSHGNIPEIFLRNAGIPDSIIEAIPSLVGVWQRFDQNWPVGSFLSIGYNRLFSHGL